MTHKLRFMAALNGQPVDRVPVSPILMFFAADRAGITYREFATNGRALAESQIAVHRRFSVDSISACSDAFRVAADLGGEMAYPESKPPHLNRPVVSSPDDIGGLGRPDPTDPKSRMADRVLGVSEMAKAVSPDVPVLGWIEMPFAEACALCGVSQFMMLLIDDPAAAHSLLEHVTNIEIDFALAQMKAGADMIGAGDAAASLLSLPTFDEFALPYEQRVCDAIHAAGGLVKLHICGDTTRLLGSMAKSGSDLINVDHMVPLDRARDACSAAGKCFKGNLDPVSQMMQATPEECESHAFRCLSTAEGTAFMLSPGCEAPAETTDSVFDAFCHAPENYRNRR